MRVTIPDGEVAITVTEKAGRVKELSGEMPPSSWTVLGATCALNTSAHKHSVQSRSASKRAHFCNSSRKFTCPHL